MRSLSQLKILKIINCQELIQITEEDAENQGWLSNHGFRDICFPKLIILFVSNCNKLKRLISVSTSHEFLKLNSLIIMGAFELKEVFEREKGEEYEDVELVLPNLEHLILSELPCLDDIYQGIQLKNVDYRVIHDCPNFKLTSNITLEDLHQKVKGEGIESVDNGCGYGPHGELLRILQTIAYNKDSGYSQHDGGIAPIASPKCNIETMEQIVQEPKNPSLALLKKESTKNVEGSVQETPMSLNASMVDSTTHDSILGHSTPMHWFERSLEAMEGKVSSNNAINIDEQGQIKPHHTEIYNQEDAETDPINLQDFDDNLITLLQSMKDDDDIIVPVPSISKIPAKHPSFKDKQLTQAMAILEASLKMPLSDIANSNNRIIHLEKALNFLSNHCWKNGVLFDGLKVIIDTLHQDFPILLSSYKKASTTMDKYKELEEKEKSIKEKHPQRIEAVETLVSRILKTKKTMAEAQQKEKYLEEQISKLQVELENTKMKIKDCEVSLLSFQEQKRQFHENAIELKNEFETVKKERFEMFEDQRKAWRALVKVDDKWSTLCKEFEENLIVARNMS